MCAVRRYAIGQPKTAKTANKPTTFQVGGYGNPSLMVDGAKGERLDAKKLAVRIKKNPNYKSGMTVEILSCNYPL